MQRRYQIKYARDERACYRAIIEADSDDSAVTQARDLIVNPIGLRREIDNGACITDPILIIDRIMDVDEVEERVYHGPPSDAREVYSENLIQLAQDLVDFSKTAFDAPGDRENTLHGIINKARVIQGEQELTHA